jgi:hypothetical protein
MTFHIDNAWYIWLALAAVLLKFNTIAEEREGQMVIVLAAFFFLGISLSGLTRYPWGRWVILLILAWGLWRCVTAAMHTHWRPPHALTTRRRLHAVCTAPMEPQEPRARSDIWGFGYTMAYIIAAIMALSVVEIVAGH